MSVVLRANEVSVDFIDKFDAYNLNKNGVLEPKELAEAAQSLGVFLQLLQVKGQTSVSRDQFINSYKTLIGDGPRRVVIKLMQDKKQWQIEKDAREKN